jgi:osmotically inducible protein OsmC
MAIRNADAVWKGDLKTGQGTVKVGSGAFEGSYSFPSRFENGRGTNPEELLGAAHAACFSMALAHGLSSAGHTPTSVHTTAKVHLDRGGDGFSITRIELETEATVPGIEEAVFRQQAENAKKNCPISKALTGTQIALNARLVSR